MTRQISDTEAQQLLAGQTPAGRPEFDELAHAMAQFRTAAYADEPQPSAAVRDRLDSPAVVGAAAASSPRGITRMFASITGWGIAAKIAVGTGAVAFGAVGVAGAGAAGALPGPLQESFDSIVSVSEEEVVEDELVEEQPPADDTEGTDDSEGTGDELPVGSEEFGSWVSENAKDPDKVGAEFGQKVSEQARELRDENRGAREGASEGDAGDDEGESSGDDIVEQSTERGGQGNGKGGRP